MTTFSTTGRYVLRVLAAVLFAVGALSLAATGASADHVSGTKVGPDVEPEFIAHEDDKNPTCIDYERASQAWTELKHDAPPANTTVSNADISVEISHATSQSFSWELTSGGDEFGGIDAVLVKSGASGHNLYRYDDPDATSNFGEATEDDGLASPGQNGISHISFCYDLGGGPTTTTPTTEEETTTTEEETTTTVEETTTTVEETTTTADVESNVVERETEVAGVQVTQPAPAAAQLARTGNSDWLAAFGVGLIAMGIAALRLSRAPKPARVIVR